MQGDFHYYATYCAAILAGFSHEESAEICYSDQFTDYCSATFLSKIKAPEIAATTQLKLEMMDTRTDVIGLQNITRIWSSFHFLPGDLYAEVKGCKKYKNKYRLICNPNGDLLVDTVKLAKDKSLQAAGIAMHVLSDTWAHRYFAGTPSLVINNTNYHFYEIDGEEERKVSFQNNPVGKDDPEKSIYVGSLFVPNENSIMNLGHGRAGHLPDYSYIKYKYLPAWGGYEEIIKDNPHDYYYAFCQMLYALEYYKGARDSFEKEKYAFDSAEKYEDRIRTIFAKRQLDSSEDWKEFGKELSGRDLEDFDAEKYQNEYISAEPEKKKDTFLGRYVEAAIAQKSMVTGRIYESGNKLAGYSKRLKEGKSGIIQDYFSLFTGIGKGDKK